MTEISSIRNMGAKMTARFRTAGILTAEEVYQLGLDNAYQRLLSAGMTAHFMAYWALAAGLEDRWFNTYSDDEKEKLRARHDELVAAHKGQRTKLGDDLDAFMNQFGLSD